MNPKRFTLLISPRAALLCWAGVALLWLLLGSPGVACADDGSTVLTGTLTVCPDGPPACDYDVIQDAVDAAAPGDTVKVATGVYIGTQGRLSPPGYPGPDIVTQVVYISKTVTIQGGYTVDFVEPPDPEANPTTLDALGEGRGLYITGNISPTIEGLRITGGDATGLGGKPINHDDAGGGVYIIDTTVLISNCQVFGNSGPWGGGGLSSFRSCLTLKDNTISANAAGRVGGGLLLWDSTATLNHNTVAVNTAGHYGGGLYLVGSDATLDGNTVSENTAAARGGGGLFMRESDLVLSRNNIVSNTAGSQGGGVKMSVSSATFTSNTISSNFASGGGGGLCLYGSEATLEGNVVSANNASSGGGLWLDRSDVTLDDNTLAGNHAHGSSGGGLLATTSDVTLYGNTIVSNTAEGEGGGLCANISAVTLISNTISDNEVDQWGGGGLALLWLSTGVLDGNTISANTGPEGGGILLSQSNVRLNGNDVVSNTASFGGGLLLEKSNVTLTNSLVAGNIGNYSGSGLFLKGSFPGSSARLLHNTIVHNSGGDGSGIYAETRDTIWLTNSILISHTVGIHVSAGGTAILEATLWGNETDWEGEGTIVIGSHNYWGNPAFEDPNGGDYHLREASAARDRGIIPDIITNRDVDGQPRLMDQGYDLGFDEYPGAGLALASQPTPVALNRGQTFSYTLAVTSAGRENVTGVVLTDTLDAWQRPMTAASSLGGVALDSNWGGSVVCTPGDLVTGTAVYVTVTAQVSAAASLRQAMVNGLVARADETSNSLGVTTYAQDCHSRIDDGPTEYSNVQAAVDAAKPGDLVEVAGTCLGVPGGSRQEKAQVYLDKSLTVRGGYSPDFGDWNPDLYPSTLDPLGMGRVLYISGPSASSTLEGLNITGGDTGWLGGGVHIFKAQATLSGCQVFNNTAMWGGGLSLLGGDASLHGNTFTDNFSGRWFPEFEGEGGEGRGGGLYLRESNATLVSNTLSANTSANVGGGLCSWGSAVTLTQNTLSANTGGAGGGLELGRSDATLISNTFSANVARTSGGGLNLWGESEAMLINNLIVDNQANRDGGGLALQDSNATLISNTFSANTADLKGGGLRLEESSATLINNLIADNQANSSGCGLYIINSSSHLLHTTIARNTGGDGSGLRITNELWPYTPSSVRLVNTILVSHAIGVYVEASNKAELDSTLWGNETDWAGHGTISRAHDYWGDPDFLDPTAGDYHIGPGSMALDRGIDAGVTLDIDGDPRPLGPGFDLGADEAPAAVPGRPILLAPPDGTVTTTQTMTFTWQAGSGSPPAGYNLDLDGTVVTTTDTTSSTLLSLGVHTWTVRAFNQVGYSDWATAWTVEVTETLPPPNNPALLWPPDGTITTTQAMTFTWQAGSGSPPAGYNLDLDGTVVTTTVTSSATLLLVGVHTWTVRAFNAAGYSDWALPWTVEIQPNQAPYVPSNPAPADDAVDVPLTATLSWQGGDPDGDPVTYTVAFGAGNPPPVVAQITATSYNPGPLAYATAYHWAITASDGLSTTAGPTWSFTTALTPCVPVTGVELSRVTPGTVYAGDTVDFQADVVPDDAAKPYTYTVSVGGQTAVQPTAGSADPLAFSHTFPATGSFTVEVAVWKCDMTQPITDAVQVNVYAPGTCIEVEGVELALLTPVPIYAGDIAQFSADLVPDDLTTPYTYTIHLDGMTLVYPQAGDTDPLTFSHTFPVTGTYTVEVAIWNCDADQAGAVTDAKTVEVVAPVLAHTVYLPIVMSHVSLSPALPRAFLLLEPSCPPEHSTSGKRVALRAVTTKRPAFSSCAQTSLYSPNDRFAPSVHVEFAIDVLQVMAYGPFADSQLFRDLPVVPAPGQQP